MLTTEDAPTTAAEKAKKVRRVTISRDHIYGNPKAAISLIEYADFECPFCKQLNPTPKEIVAEYRGKVNWVYRHFPVAMHNPGAQKEAEASECAASVGGDNAVRKFADAIYARTFQINCPGTFTANQDRVSAENSSEPQLGCDVEQCIFARSVSSGQNQTDGTRHKPAFLRIFVGCERVPNVRFDPLMGVEALRKPLRRDAASK